MCYGYVPTNSLTKGPSRNNFRTVGCLWADLGALLDCAPQRIVPYTPAVLARACSRAPLQIHLLACGTYFLTGPYAALFRESSHLPGKQGLHNQDPRRLSLEGPRRTRSHGISVRLPQPPPAPESRPERLLEHPSWQKTVAADVVVDNLISPVPAV